MKEAQPIRIPAHKELVRLKKPAYFPCAAVHSPCGSEKSQVPSTCTTRRGRRRRRFHTSIPPPPQPPPALLGSTLRLRTAGSTIRRHRAGGARSAPQAEGWGSVRALVEEDGGRAGQPTRRRWGGWFRCRLGSAMPRTSSSTPSPSRGRYCTYPSPIPPPPCSF